LFGKLIGRTPKVIDQDEYRRFAVFVPVLPESNSLLFEVRADRLKRQPGEICFPGGLIETGETPAEAAARELGEELLVPPENCEILAPLDILMDLRNSMIYPHIGYLHNYNGKFCQEEVKEVFSVPVDFFMKNKPQVFYNNVIVKTSEDFPYHLIGGENYDWHSGTYPVFFYSYNDKIIWGLTARIVNNLTTLL